MKTPCPVLGGQRETGADTRPGRARHNNAPHISRPSFIQGSGPQVWSRLGQIWLQPRSPALGACAWGTTTEGEWVGGRLAAGRNGIGPGELLGPGWHGGGGSCWGTMRGRNARIFLSPLIPLACSACSLTQAGSPRVRINVLFSAWPKSRPYETFVVILKLRRLSC